MSTTSYKCLSCGAGIHYKPELQKFKCDYCLSEYSEEELLNQSKKETVGKLNSYTCESCGAKVVTDDTTTSTLCYYCHNPVIISDRLEGEFLPDKIIPFTIDRDRAQKIFLEWVGNKMFVPSDFTSSSQLEKITGIYIPYWWVDYKADIDYVGEGRRITVWRSDNREYKQTDKYQIIRSGKIDINNIGELALTKIDNNLLNGIGPFNESEAIPFSMPYLSGFFAEQYNIKKEEIAPVIEKQAKKYFRYLIDESIGGYNRVRTIRNSIDIDLEKWNYTLLPAWILTYVYKNKTYVFAVNGQTGKAHGKLPLSNNRLAKAFGIVSAATAATFLLLLAGGMFIW